MSDTWNSYSKDTRVPCRYGTRCYSKNVDHQRKFKHPPKNLKRKNGDEHDYDKRPKPNTEDRTSTVKEEKPNVPQTSVNQVSESELLTSNSLPEKPKQMVPSLVKTCQEQNADHQASDTWYSYARDPRKPCRYASRCFSKNDHHIKMFKHPPKNIKQKTCDGHNYDQPKPKIESQQPIGTEPESHVPHTFKEVPESGPQNLKTTPEKSNQNIPSPGRPVVLPNILTFYNENADKSLVKELFLLEMPPDFYKFFECLKTEESVEKILSSVNLQLIGPFELLMGKLPIVDKELYLVHWRFFYDPPEFQAVIKTKGKSEFHMGYYRDAPDDRPVFVASNDSAKDCHITPMAENIFGAVYCHLQNEKKKSPFVAMACQKVMDKVKKWAEEAGFSLDEYGMKKRQAHIVTKTFHGAGIVVPYDKKTQLGYRKLVETDAAIKKMFARLATATTQFEKDKVLSDLQPVITYASIAVDECDFGTGLEVGIALFCSGIKELESSAMSSLCSSYMLLNREAFAKIFEVHLKYRRKGPAMSLDS